MNSILEPGKLVASGDELSFKLNIKKQLLHENDCIPIKLK